MDRPVGTMAVYGFHNLCRAIVPRAMRWMTWIGVDAGWRGSKSNAPPERGYPLAVRERIRVQFSLMEHKRNVFVVVAVLALIAGLVYLIPRSHRDDTPGPPSPVKLPEPVTPVEEAQPKQAPDQPDARGNETARKTGTLTGQVTCEQTGAVCSGAHVRLEWSGAVEPLAVVRTDDEGRYRISRILPGSYYIRLLTDASPQVFAGFHVRAGEETKLDLKVPPGSARIYGRVTDRKTGEPIAGDSGVDVSEHTPSVCIWSGWAI